MKQIKVIKGFRDVLPDEAAAWQYLQQKARDILHVYGYSEIIIPVIEVTDLFLRSIGETTDIVEKEMYTFEDRDGKKITLRPEGTASVVRAYIEHNIHQAAPFSKLYYIGPMFRRDRPQAGRYRQFYQIGAEVFGFDHPMADAEMISMLNLFFRSLNITGLELQVNSLGCTQCRPGFRESLQAFFKGRSDALCPNCQRRFELNPLRILDCKSGYCRALSEDAPKTLDYLCANCLEHFGSVQDSLKAVGVPFTLNQRLVRGLDYYTSTAFEFVSMSLGAQNTVAAGGRYDTLVEDLGGPSVPAIGFSIGMERLLSIFDSGPLKRRSPQVFIAALGEKARGKSFLLMDQLHKEGISAIIDYNGGSLKSLMRKAGRFNAGYVLIIGEDELLKGSFILRDMKNKTQADIPLTSVASHLQALLAPSLP